MRFLSQTPILPLDGASPIELTRAAFGRMRDRHRLVAPVFDCSESLGRVKTALRRCAVLWARPAPATVRQLPERRRMCVRAPSGSAGGATADVRSPRSSAQPLAATSRGSRHRQQGATHDADMTLGSPLRDSPRFAEPKDGGPEQRQLEPRLTPWPRADLKAMVNTRVPRLTRQRRSDDSAAIGKRPDFDHLSVTCSLQPSDRKRFAVSHDESNRHVSKFGSARHTWPDSLRGECASR